MSFSLSRVTPATRRGSTIRLEWASQALDLMGKLYGGATGFTELCGIWRDDENDGQLLTDKPIMIQSLAKREDVEDPAKIGELAKLPETNGEEQRSKVLSRSSLTTPFTLSRTTTDMNELDQLTISRILGSTVRPISRPAFGGFSAVGTVGQMLANRPIEIAPLAPDKSRDSIIVKAFAEVHDGYSVDRTLADPQLAAQFVKRCQQLGIDALARRNLSSAPSAEESGRVPGQNDQGGQAESPPIPNSCRTCVRQVDVPLRRELRRPFGRS